MAKLSHDWTSPLIKEMQKLLAEEERQGNHKAAARTRASIAREQEGFEAEFQARVQATRT
ncbi:MAG: hypothetical protein HOZ81_20460 [Streptomyces sp.]|nr:hypothetical protein [Streptomyces sp.]